MSLSPSALTAISDAMRVHSPLASCRTMSVTQDFDLHEFQPAVSASADDRVVDLERLTSQRRRVLDDVRRLDAELRSERLERRFRMIRGPR
jgi:hypothetical protein